MLIFCSITPKVLIGAPFVLKHKNTPLAFKFQINDKLFFNLLIISVL